VLSPTSPAITDGTNHNEQSSPIFIPSIRFHLNPTTTCDTSDHTYIRVDDIFQPPSLDEQVNWEKIERKNVLFESISYSVFDMGRCILLEWKRWSRSVGICFVCRKFFFSNEFDWSVLNEIGEIGAFLIRPSSPANVSCTHQYVLFIWLNHIPNRLIFFRHWVFTHSKE